MVQGWQPIESAPKDGSMMLISVGDRGGVGESWFSRSDDKWYWASGDAAQSTPTHWMPLPSPPDLDQGRSQIESLPSNDGSNAKSLMFMGV